MGTVSDYLIETITKQIVSKGIVVWFDPEQHYTDLAQHLTIPDTMILRYDGSFFALRQQAEPFINGTEPPRMVIYLPLSEKDAQNALVELECMGVRMQPGEHSHTCNTRLSLLARYALTPGFGLDKAMEIEVQVAEGKFSLAELDTLAEKGTDITSGSLSIIFGTNNAREVALQFLNATQCDAALEKRGAMPELKTVLYNAFGLGSSGEEAPEAYRQRLARFMLATDFIANLDGEVPSHLHSIDVAQQRLERDACVELAKIWRLRLDLAQSYETHADRIERELNIYTVPFTATQLQHVETFKDVEAKVQDIIALSLQENVSSAIMEQAKSRQTSFWSTHQPELQARWALIVAAGQVLLAAQHIQQALKSSLTAKEIVQAYTDAEQPWCLLDTYHRHMERLYHDFSFSFNEALEQLLNKARQRYMSVGETLAEIFLQKYRNDNFQGNGILLQREIFEKKVKPNLPAGKIAYVWVDALRYEMAYELVKSSSYDAEIHMEAALATVPTITPIGMASLLPEAHTAVKLAAVNDNRLALEINGTVIKDRRDRINFLKTHAGVKVFDAKLGDLLPKPSKKVSEEIRQADLIVITSQEIDLLGEGNNTHLARGTMDEILRQLRQAFRILGQQGIKTIVFTADHGYLFADELSSDMKIDAPKGRVVELHRRAWIGQGGEIDASYLRAHIADFGIESDLDIAVPWGFGCFKVRSGADAYFHGGMSPQELIVPVVTVKSKKSAPGVAGEIQWELSLNSKKITTRVCSVQVAGKGNSLFELMPPKVRLEIRDSQAGQASLSFPASASYGYDELTGEVQMKLDQHDQQKVETNIITLLITEPKAQANVSIHLVDSTSGVELARIDNIEMSIAL